MWNGKWKECNTFGCLPTRPLCNVTTSYMEIIVGRSLVSHPWEVLLRENLSAEVRALGSYQEKSIRKIKEAELNRPYQILGIE